MYTYILKLKKKYDFISKKYKLNKFDEIIYYIYIIKHIKRKENADFCENAYR